MKSQEWEDRGGMCWRNARIEADSPRRKLSHDVIPPECFDAYELWPRADYCCGDILLLWIGKQDKIPLAGSITNKWLTAHVAYTLGKYQMESHWQWSEVNKERPICDGHTERLNNGLYGPWTHVEPQCCDCMSHWGEPGGPSTLTLIFLVAISFTKKWQGI